MKLVPNKVSLAAARSVLTGRKHSPQMLFAAGVIGVGATVVLACRATLRVEEVLVEHERKADLIKQAQARVGLQGYSGDDAKHDSVKLTVQTGVALGRLYAPAIVVGAVSVAALAGSHNILSKRNAALTAAYGTVSKAFDGYRDRVRDAYGEDRERELYEDVQMCEIEDPITKKTTKRKMSGGATPYSFLYGPGNANYERLPEHNFMFLKMKQTQLTQRLGARGHLFLNEVLDELGFEHTMEGSVVGWLYNQGGDDFVDFGIFNDKQEERVVQFMIGREDSIWLSFNVDGTIYDKI